MPPALRTLSCVNPSNWTTKDCMELINQFLTLRQTSTFRKNIVDISTKDATLWLARVDTSESNQFVYIACPWYERCTFQFAKNLKWLSKSCKVLHVTPRWLYWHLWDFSTHDVGHLHDALIPSYFDLEVLHGHRNPKRLSFCVTPVEHIPLRVTQG